VRPKTTSSADASLNLVANHRNLIVAGQFSESAKERGRCMQVSAFAQDWLHDESSLCGISL
jgi:hypothetical protein